MEIDVCRWKRNLKADNKNVNFPNKFCLGSISNECNDTESRDVFLNRNVYTFFSQ